MDTTKDIVDANSESEEENNVDVVIIEQPNTNNNNTSNTSSGLNTNSSITTPSGLQQIEDDSSDMPLSMGMAEEISNRVEPPKQKIGKVEQIDDDDSPEPPTAMLEASLNAADITNKIMASSKTATKLSAAALIRVDASNMNPSSTQLADLTEALQSGRINAKEVQDILNALDPTTTPTTGAKNTNELNPPVPFNSAEFEEDEDAIAKKKAKDMLMNQKPAAVSVLPPSNRDSIYEPSRAVEEDLRGITSTNRRGWEDIESRAARRDMESRAARRDIESQSRTNEHDNSAGSINNDSMMDTEADVGQTSTNQGLPEVEAYLVEDIEEEDVEVYIATPTLPWWKQRRTKILLGVVLAIVATLSIVLGIELSKDDGQVTVVNNVTNMIVNVTDSPSISLAPSSSSAPSSSPTECVNKIISNRQEIDLKEHLLIDNPHDAKIAVDGQNMVVVALDGKYYLEIRDEGGRVNDIKYDGPAYITFYTLNNNNDEWQREQAPFRVDNVGYGSTVAMSGDTAFIGFGRANNYTGDVLNYEQDRFGEWVRMDDPFVHTANTTQKSFGMAVDIDGDLSCIYDMGSDWGDYINLYHRNDESKWVQFDTIRFE